MYLIYLGLYLTGLKGERFGSEDCIVLIFEMKRALFS